MIIELLNKLCNSSPVIRRQSYKSTEVNLSEISLRYDDFNRHSLVIALFIRDGLLGVHSSIELEAEDVVLKLQNLCSNLTSGMRYLQGTRNNVLEMN